MNQADDVEPEILNPLTLAAEENGVRRQVSKLLIPGEIYTRETLKTLLATSDATINTGVFRPEGFDSILLFVTKNKSKDRVQFNDQLNENTLHWQGQEKGRKDQLIVEHIQRGLELLLFYRDDKFQFAGAGFRYEGCFIYVSHSGREPADFVLHRELPYLAALAPSLESGEGFNPMNEEDARRRIFGALVRRQGQPAFRRALLSAYEGRCAMSGYAVNSVLEAAHIMPYRGAHTNHVTNGLLLRADLHTLFDMGLIAVGESKVLVVASALHGTPYVEMHGRSLFLPTEPAHQPNMDALRSHRLMAGL